MSDERRFWLIVACATGSMAAWPGTHSWVVFFVRPWVVLLALLALAPWRSP